MTFALNIKVALIFSAALILSTGMAAAGAQDPLSDEACFETSAWPEADLLFRGNSHWIGSDGAYSVDLGNERTLWLFDDTWIDPTGQQTRNGAQMIRNSVAIQTGADPSNATIKYYWRTAANKTPLSFFSEQGTEWVWLGPGLRIGNQLVLFLTRVRSVETGLGFAHVGWRAVTIDNPDEEPSDWHINELQTPANSGGIIVGYAGIYLLEGYLYAFGEREDYIPSKPLYVARWPVEKVVAGDLQRPEWWGGEDVGWISNESTLPCRALFENGQYEMTFHFDAIANQFIAVQTVGFGSADIAIRTAPRITGPWTEPKLIYRPPEYNRPNVMIYAAKVHLQLEGAEFVLTYATNTFEFGEHFSDSEIYYPHFVRMARCKQK